MAASISNSSDGDKSESENSVDCLTLDFGPFEAVNSWQKMPDVNKFVGAPRSKHTIVTFNNGIYVRIPSIRMLLCSSRIFLKVIVHP